MEKEINGDIQEGDWVKYNSNIEENEPRIRKVLGVSEITLILMGPDGFPYKGYKMLYRLASLGEIRRHQVKSVLKKEV